MSGATGPRGLHIAGQWRRPEQVEPNINPSDTREVVGEFAMGTEQDVRDAVAAAHRAFPAWSRAAPQQRAAIISRS